MGKIALPAGFEDITPEQMGKWKYLEKTIRSLFPRYGFSEIRTPCLENTDLFIRSIGEDTDIVGKEMYTFGKEGDSVSLRPEGTAPVIRSYIENGHDKFGSFQKYWYMGPMFRHEKPQKGRKRQFHQAGVEILGSDLPSADVDIIVLAYRLMKALRVDNFDLKLNSTGCKECRDKYKAALRSSLKPFLDDMCGDCQRRYETNILRILDCKKEMCRKFFDKIPDILGFLCDGCRGHHEMLKEYLFDMDIEFEEDRFLVRGLDYYTRTVFEITHSGLGAQDALLGGGRYDDLVEQMGGKPRPAVGFAAGLDRIFEVMGETAQKELRRGIYLITLGEKAYTKGFSLVHEFRNNGIKADLDFEERSIKSQMKLADRRGFRMAAILGEDELEQNQITFRDLKEGTEVTLPLDDVVGKVSTLLREIDEKLKQQVQDSQMR